jgi:ribonucleoside-diphosphate reductase alpha chain
MEGTKLIEVHPLFEHIARERGFYSAELMERIAGSGSLHDFDEVPDDVKRLFVTAHDIAPVEHVSMQAAFQRYVDNAVSKTVNFNHDATKKDVEEVYMLSYRMGCKGVTVYRDGSRDEQVLSTGGTGKDAGQEQAEVSVSVGVLPRKRPEAMHGTTRLMTTGCGKLYVTINQDKDGNVFEVFTQMGKAGGCAASQSEALGRMISLALRSNISKTEITTQLKGISCHQPAWSSTGRVLSCADAIAKSFENFIAFGAEAKTDDNGNGGNGGKPAEASAAAPPAAPSEEHIMIVGACPECGGTVEHEGGCAVCHNCGFTRCG